MTGHLHTIQKTIIFGKEIESTLEADVFAENVALAVFHNNISCDNPLEIFGRRYKKEMQGKNNFHYKCSAYFTNEFIDLNKERHNGFEYHTSSLIEEDILKEEEFLRNCLFDLAEHIRKIKTRIYGSSGNLHASVINTKIFVYPEI